jgi:hypothetical protein
MDFYITAQLEYNPRDVHHHRVMDYILKPNFDVSGDWKLMYSYDVNPTNIFFDMEHIYVSNTTPQVTIRKCNCTNKLHIPFSFNQQTNQMDFFDNAVKKLVLVWMLH